MIGAGGEPWRLVSPARARLAGKWFAAYLPSKAIGVPPGGAGIIAGFY
jgi:hypothetical protein